jgi:hypothetical protein
MLVSKRLARRFFVDKSLPLISLMTLIRPNEFQRVCESSISMVEILM